jgi:hypothetical protein
VKQGAWYSETALLDAQSRVFKMGVFGAVKVNRGAPDRASLTVPVVVDVREAPIERITATGIQTRRQASLPPPPLEHQAAKHAPFARAGGGGAHGLARIRRMPEVGQDAQAPLLQLRGLGVFVLVDDVLVGAFLHQLAGLRLHPGAHEGGQIQAGVAIEHQVVVDELIGVRGVEAAGGERIAGDLGGQVGGGQAGAEAGAEPEVAGAAFRLL